MLVITRFLEESVIIGTDIEVRILGVRGTQVRLGIDAPRNVPVHRKEIAARIAADAEETYRRGAPGR